MTFPRFFYSIGNKKLFLDHFTQSQQALKNSSQHRRMSRFSQKWLEHTKDNKQILLVNYCPRAPKSSLNLPLNHGETSFMLWIHLTKCPSEQNQLSLQKLECYIKMCWVVRSLWKIKQKTEHEAEEVQSAFSQTKNNRSLGCCELCHVSKFYSSVWKRG